MKLNRIFCMAFTLTVLGCGKSLSPIEYVRWVENEENGLRVKRVVGDFEFIAQYKPIDYVIAQEEKSNEIAPGTYKERKENLTGFVYINLIIKSQDGQTPVLQNRTTPQGYYNRINYFLADASQDFLVLRGKDTLDCTLCHFEQNYGLVAENVVVLVFKPRSNYDTKEDLVLIYDDNVLGVGQIRIKITGSSLKNVPAMSIG